MNYISSRRLFSIVAAAVLYCFTPPSMGIAYASSTGTLQAQKVSVTGTVRDTHGEPMPGVRVMQKNTRNGTLTNAKGEFRLGAPKGSTLVFSYIGYKTAEVKVSAAVVNIVLDEDAELLSEVVVVGYGTQKKENLTGAVSSVNVKETFSSRPLPDAGRGLQGTVPGLSVVIPSGEVGSSAVMKIRGQIGSINGASTPLILVDNVEVPNLDMINPNDIESISVLKDAASASIYGSRAAFGVILVTTKKGQREERPVIVYSNNLSWQSPFKKIEIAGIDGLRYSLDAHRNMKGAGPGGGFWRVDEESLKRSREWLEKYGGVVKSGDPVVYNRDWYWDGTQKFGVRIYDPVGMMVKPHAFSHSHNLSLSGGSKGTSYNLSFGYLNQEGMMKPAPKDEYERFNFKIDLSTDINRYLSVRGGASFSDGKKYYPYSLIGFSADPWLYIYRWSRLFPIGSQEHGVDVRDSYFDTKKSHTATTQKRFSNFYGGVDINFTEDWVLKGDYSFQSYLRRDLSSIPRAEGLNDWYRAIPWMEDGKQVYVDEEGKPVDSGGVPAYRFPKETYISKEKTGVYHNTHLASKHTVNAYTTYKKDFAQAHKLQLMAGMNLVANNWRSHWSNKSELLFNDMPEFNLATGTETAGGGRNWDALLGYFGRLNYSFMDRYLFEANLRYDGSSKFPKDMQWRWYPSFSGGWVLSNERFMEGLQPTLSFAKLRASWGTIGDQTVQNVLYMPTMDVSKTSWLGGDGKPYFQISTPSPVSSSLTWQDIETLNLGLDMRFFRNSWGVTFEWFRRDTKNMIIPGETLPSSFGASAPSGNYGNLRTHGWEITTDFSHRFENGLRLSVNANLADVVTMITKAADWNTPWENRLIDNTFTTGKRYGDIYGFVTDRLYQKEDFVYDEKGDFVQTNIIWEGTGKRTNMLAGHNPVYQTYFEDGNQILLMQPGDVRFVDVNGDGYITPGKGTNGDPGDRVVVGNFTPRYEYGVRLGADWKGFDASIFVQGVGKRKIWGSGQLAIPGFHVKDGAMPQAIAANYWRPDRTDAFYPRAWNLNGSNQGYVMRTQSRYMLNMAYTKIKNITLGYTMPKEILNPVYISNARIYLSLENFFTFDKLRGLPIDPETISGSSPFRSDNGYNLGRTGTGNPPFKSASIGLQVTL